MECSEKNQKELVKKYYDTNDKDHLRNISRCLYSMYEKNYRIKTFRICDNINLSDDKKKLLADEAFMKAEEAFYRYLQMKHYKDTGVPLGAVFYLGFFRHKLFDLLKNKYDYGIKMDTERFLIDKSFEGRDVDEKYNKDLLEKALNKISAKSRELLYEGMNTCYREIANKEDKQPNSIKNQMYRIREQVKKNYNMLVKKI